MDVVKIEGLKRVVDALRKKAAQYSREEKPSVIVGFTAAYALFLHENMEIWPPGMRLAGQPRPKTASGTSQGLYWDPQGRAGPKFLENPAREMASDGTLQRLVREQTMRTKSLAQGLVAAGLAIQREAMLRVPVNFGNLKASAFTRLETPT